MDTPTRQTLIETAATLFLRQGFHATGLSDILQAAGVPKGSLYHHFPGGKADLGIAAADWAAAGIEYRIDKAYGAAGSFSEGTEAFCASIARLFCARAE